MITASLKVNARLNINVVGVLRPADAGERLVNVVAGEKVAVADFELRKSRERVTRDHVQFRSEKAAVIRVNSVAIGCARRSADVVKIIVRVGEPETVAFERNTHARRGLELENAANVLNVLQRDKIHVTVKLVVGRKQVVERSMRAVPGIAVAGRISEF